MAILGVLLGITMCVVAGSIWFGHREWKGIIHRSKVDDCRIAMLERRKAPLPVVAPANDEKFPKIRMRAWNEDAVIPEVTK